MSAKHACERIGAHVKWAKRQGGKPEDRDQLADDVATLLANDMTFGHVDDVFERLRDRSRPLDDPELIQRLDQISLTGSLMR